MSIGQRLTLHTTEHIHAQPLTTWVSAINQFERNLHNVEDSSLCNEIFKVESKVLKNLNNRRIGSTSIFLILDPILCFRKLKEDHAVLFKEAVGT